MPTKKELEERISLLEAENLKQHVMPDGPKRTLVKRIKELLLDIEEDKVSSVVLAWNTYEPNLPKLTPGLYKRIWIAQKFNDLYGLTHRLLREFDHNVEEDNTNIDNKT